MPRPRSPHPSKAALRVRRHRERQKNHEKDGVALAPVLYVADTVTALVVAGFLPDRVAHTPEEVAQALSAEVAAFTAEQFEKWGL